MSNNNVVGLGVDVKKLVAQLMEVEKQQLDRMDKSQALLSSQRNQYTRLSHLLKDFNSRINELNPILNQNAYKTISSDNNVLSALANSGQLHPEHILLM